MKPLKVKIVTPNELLTAGRPVPLRCETWGSHPPAKIVWLLDGEPIRSADVTVSVGRDDANLTASILTLKVVAENDGAELTCRTTNPWFSTGALEDRRVISVACKYMQRTVKLTENSIQYWKYSILGQYFDSEYLTTTNGSK